MAILDESNPYCISHYPVKLSRELFEKARPCETIRFFFWFVFFRIRNRRRLVPRVTGIAEPPKIIPSSYRRVHLYLKKKKKEKGGGPNKPLWLETFTRAPNCSQWER